MVLRFLGLADGRLQRARRAIHKLLALGFSETEILRLMREHGGHVRRTTAGTLAPRQGVEKEARLRLAQWSIRTMIALGFDETEIANLAGVDHTTIAHILASDGSRTVSEEIAIALKESVQRAGKERLKLLLPRLEIRVLDTCNEKGRDVTDATTGAETAESVRALIRNALILASAPVPAVAGIHGFLAQIGDPKDWMYVFGAPFDRRESDDARVMHLRLVEHELGHILQRFRIERRRLEKLRRHEANADIPKDGRIA